MAKNPNDGGFSLVEVICAMAVAAMAIVALMRGMQSSQSATIYLDAHLGARIIAQSILEDERQASGTAPGERSGDSGPFRWRLRIDPAAVDVVPKPASGFQLYRLSVEVRWEPRGSFTVDTLKVAKNR